MTARFHSHFRVFAFCAAIAGGAIHSFSSSAWGETVGPYWIWNGGNGNWSDPKNWLTDNSYPVEDFHMQCWIDADSAVASHVLLDISEFVARLRIDAADSLTIDSGKSLMFAASGSTLQNAGTISLAGNPDGGTELESWIRIASTSLTVSGGGTTTLQNLAAGIAANPGAVNPSLIIIDQTINGAGRLGDQTLAIVNYGLIDANIPYRPLIVSPNVQGLINQSKMQASDGGVLRLEGGTFFNQIGDIAVTADSHVELPNAVVIGGVLRTEGNGVIRSHHAPFTLDGVALRGRLEVGPTSLTLRGDVTSDAVIDLLGGDALLPPSVLSEILIPPGETKLNGVGTVNMRWCRIRSGVSVGGKLAIGPDQTFVGEGLLGYNSIGLKNSGKIIADRENPIVIDPIDAQLMHNLGTMQASGPGGIVLLGGTFRNDGIIEVGPGSKVMFTSGSNLTNVSQGILSGGTWRVIGTSDVATLIVASADVIFSDADITLSGANSQFAVLDSLAINLGKLTLQHGRAFSTTSGGFFNEGQLTIESGARFLAPGVFHQTATATLNFQLHDGLPDSEMPPLKVGSVMELTGALNVIMAPGFNPPMGARMTLIEANGFLGSFSSISAPSGVTIQITPTAIEAVVTKSACAADLDGTNVVDVADLLLLLSAWGMCSAEDCGPDLNNDEVVNITDLLILVSSWGPCPNPAPQD